MLDIKILRNEPERIQDALKRRFNDLDITPAIELDKQRREILTEVEKKKAAQNEISKKIYENACVFKYVVKLATKDSI